jgi:hypothetical protein
MARVRLREVPPPAEPDDAAARPIALTPLRISGLVVRKADVVEALRVYAPGLVDLHVTEDGEHFWLLLGEESGRGRPDPGSA